MSNTEKKQNNFLKKIKDLDFKLDLEKETIKHNDLIKEELDNINRSYNRCLDILSRTAKGELTDQKYNELYAENRANHLKNIDYIDSQSEQSKKNIRTYQDEKSLLEDKLKKEENKKDS